MQILRTTSVFFFTVRESSLKAGYFITLKVVKMSTGAFCKHVTLLLMSKKREASHTMTNNQIGHIMHCTALVAVTARKCYGLMMQEVRKFYLCHLVWLPRRL